MGYFIDKRDEVNYVDKGIWNEKHYSEDKYFRTNLYKIRNIKINIPFSKRSKQVTDMRNSITSKSISCIGSVFYFIYKKLGLDAEIGKKGVVLAGTNVGIEKENDILLVSKFKAIEEEFDYTNTVFLRNSHRKKNDFSFDAVLK